MAGLALGSDEDREERQVRDEKRSRPDRRLEQLIGQVLVTSFEGTEPPPYLLRQLTAGEIAGVVLFGRNVGSAGRLRALTARLGRAAGGDALVLVDQEGGEIRNVPFAGPQPPQPEQGDPGSVRSLMSSSARELRAAGVNVNLAPVLDVAGPEGSVVAGRAYAGGPEEVSRAGRSALEGMRAGRVAATAKHFPGLGRAGENTDDAPVTITASHEELERTDLAPFRVAIAAGAPLVMASHAVYPALDRRNIASQSQTILDDLLRRRLGFRGAVLTDSIEAEAVLRRSSVAAAAERSLLAGADLVLMTGSGTWKLVYPHLLRRAGRSPPLRRAIARSAARVVDLKRELGLRSVSAGDRLGAAR